MEYKVAFVGYGYIEAESEEEAILSFDPSSDCVYTENTKAEVVH